MIVSRRGVTWDVGAPDDFWSTLWLDGWEDFTLDCVDRFAREDATLIDIGAWVGPVSLWAARRGPVLAVEPDPTAYEYLVRNVAKNAPENIYTAPYAVSTVTGSGGMIVARGTHGDSMSYLDYGEDGRAGPSVYAYTFPDLLASFYVDFVSLVKMDIEGGECDVLEHVGPYCSERGIPLLVSMHEPWWTRPVDPAWLSGFASVEGSLSGWGQVLCS